MAWLMRLGFAVWATMVPVTTVSRTDARIKTGCLLIPFTNTPVDVDLSLTLYGRRILFQRVVRLQKNFRENESVLVSEARLGTSLRDNSVPLYGKEARLRPGGVRRRAREES